MFESAPGKSPGSVVDMKSVWERVFLDAKDDKVSPTLSRTVFIR